MDAVENQEPLTVNQVIKKELEKLYDPEPDMTQEEHEAYHKKLLAKIESGKKLTVKEMNYLRMHDPAAYQKARRMEQKREKLKTQMKHCKSKQEVAEVVSDAISHISEKDPDKEAIIATYKEAFKEFKKTPKYNSLPDTKREAEAKELHGKRKKLYLEGKGFSEIDMWFLDMDDEKYGEDGLRRVDDGATPLSEVYDAMPSLDITS